MTNPMQTAAAAAAFALMLMNSAAHADGASLKVVIGGLDHTGRFADSAAFCPPASSATKNVSPAVSWSAGPQATRAYALLMTDPDVPQDFSQINKPGVTIAAEASRVSVYHWVIDDIPATVTSIAAGAESEGLVVHGKPVGMTDHGRRGANVFTSFLAGNAEMAGTYGGYDGPCPPVNDERPHHYVVRVFALDVASLGLSGPFDGAAVEQAMRGHILAEGQATATYALNPSLKP
jgi:Raf kinase inhibitor-like YbhB/YbcL family protein